MTRLQKVFFGLLLALIFVMTLAFAACNGIHMFKFEQSGDGYVLTEFIGFAKHVDIPDTYKDLPVVGIGTYAFNGSNFLSITIPDGVTSIGEGAFLDCRSLTTVNIGAGSKLESIGPSAFRNCYSLTSITIPDSVTSIGDYAFYFLDGVLSNSDGFFSSSDGFLSSSLTTVNIGASSKLESIGECAFRYCRSLTSITIPNGVTSIGDHAFESCSSLTTVNIGASSKLESIGESAFWNCRSLTSITIPNGVTSIGDHAFASCSSLTTVNIGASSKLESIGEQVFYGCSSLTSITIPNGVTSIGDVAFCGCGNLKSINIPDGVTSIGESAFAACRSLTSIFIPESVIVMGHDAFAHVDDLTIYCEVTEQPSGWSYFWKNYGSPVVWGATRQDAEQH